DADARLLAPDVRPPSTSWSWAQNRAFFGQSLVDGGLRGGAQFAVDFMLISMSEQQGVGPTEFAYLVGGQERRQALLPVVVAAFDLAFGLGGWGIAQRDAIEMECGTQLGESIWIMGVEEGVVVNVEGQRQAMRTGGRTMVGGRKYLLTGFVIVEIAVSVIVVTGAGLLVKTLLLLSAANPGFQADRLLTFQVTPNDSLCKDRNRCAAFYRDLMTRARAIPGVTDVSAVSALPLSGDFDNFAAESDSRPYKKGEIAPSVWTARIAPGYLDTMKIPLLQGRPLMASDYGERTEPVAVVSATAAKKFWPGENAVGKHIRGVWQTGWHRVVGVVGEVKTSNLAADPAWLDGAVYLPYTSGIDGDPTGILTMVVRTTGEPLALFPTMRRLVAR